MSAEDRYVPIVLPEITPQPRILIEYTIHAGPDHPLNEWPNAISGFRPLVGHHRNTFARWFTARGIPILSNDSLFVWQIAIAPAESMNEIFREIFKLNVEANTIGAQLTTNQHNVAKALEELKNK